MALTKYPEGSVRELIKVAFPLMLSSLSLLAMVFADRVFLARYTGEALSAAVTAGTASWAILGSILILGSMAEVFVAQYNGAGLHHRLGRPVWQMIWFSLAATLFLVPIGLWGGQILFRGSENFVLENRYFGWLTYFGSSWALVAALSAFWVGRGKTLMVTLLALGANGVNILLDWLLIFGVEGKIPAMGVVGAAIGTSTGNMLQAIVLLCLFLNAKNRKEFGTGRFHLHYLELKRCLKVGVPQATLFFVECMGFAFFYMLISHRGAEHIYVAGASQSILILFFFVAEGIGRGAAALTGNLIGAGRPEGSFKVFRAGVKLHLFFVCLMAFLLVFFPQPLVDLFMSDTFLTFGETGAMDPAVMSAKWDMMAASLIVTLRICLLYLLAEGIRWLISGILASAGDTLFLLVAGTISVPLALLLPTYLFVSIMGAGVAGAFVVAVFFVLVVATCFYWRFVGRRWQQLQIIGHEA